MHVLDIHNDDTVLTGFEVWNTTLSRGRACRIASRVPGARVIRRPRLSRWSPYPFCEFEVDSVHFLIIEPFGDNSRYWIVAKDVDASARPLIERVRSAFAAAW